MKTWGLITLSFVLGGIVGFLTSEKISGDTRVSELTVRVASLEVRSQKLADDERVPKLAERVAALEERDIATVARSPTPAAGMPRTAAGRALPVSLEGAPVRGPADAPVTIVEFSDFQCPFCTRVHPTLLRILEAYPDTVRLVFKHYPLSFHRDAPLAHRASLAADRQGRFWEMHDKIFTNSRDLSRRTLIQHAKDLDLDVAQFTRDLDSKEVIALLDRDMAEGERLGITGTPTFVINGRVMSGAQPYENFKVLIEREAARAG